jgi:hypothetical protein
VTARWTAEELAGVKVRARELADQLLTVETVIYGSLLDTFTVNRLIERAEAIVERLGLDPSMTVADLKRLIRIGQAVDALGGGSGG